MMTNEALLSAIEKQAKSIYSNLTTDELVPKSLERGEGKLTDRGALAADTGEFTGRSPKDKFMVQDEKTKDTVWWGNVNQPISPEKFDALLNKVIKHIEGKELFIRHANAGADPNYRVNIQVITESAYQNLFAKHLFLRPTAEEAAMQETEWLIIASPSFKANGADDGVRQHNFTIVDMSRKIILIGGSGYTGEIKKGIFGVMNYILPQERNVLSMHCSANVGEEGDTAIFFGLSGTGKTTLSADPKRKLIGDDEHGWTNDNTIFNFEGGCYAKVIDLSEEKEPDIFKAIRPGAILENVIFKDNGEVDFGDSSITENTRVSYPIDHINNIQPGSLANNPKNIFFLTADAYGVLPPISKLDANQAAYHFISGYTAKVAGTEEGVTEPKAVFSACFGAPFMPLHPTAYADMLAQKMKAADTNVWLINTGWSGGSYGVGTRMKLSYTRAMITAAMNGHLDDVSYTEHPVFGLAMPNAVPGVPTGLLNPVSTWESEEEYDETALILAQKFIANFKEFADQASDEVRSAAPRVYSNAR